jgi:hypothetical protein
MDGAVQKIAKEIGDISSRTVKRIWSTYRERILTSGPIVDMSSRRAGNCGRKSMLTAELRDVYIDILQSYANLWIRLSNASLVKELSTRGFNLSRCTVQNHLKLLNARKTNLRVNPTLTEAQKAARCQWILNKADRSHGLYRENHVYKAGFDTVHVDESWFYLQRVSNEVLLIDGVVAPDAPTTRHKSHIIKVMFLVALARPCRFPNGEIFNGKIGMWPCVKWSPAQRTSKNRVKGTNEMQPRSLDSDFYYELFTKRGGVIDAIKKKMFPALHRTIYIQQDGARPHTGRNVMHAIETFGSTNRWTFKMETQPAQSPDLNILDLGFFHSLKTRVAHLKHQARNLPELVAKIELAFKEYDYNTLNNVWGHLFACYNSILAANGGNQYNAPHSGVRTRAAGGLEAVNLSIDLDNYNRVYDMFN